MIWRLLILALPLSARAEPIDALSRLPVRAVESSAFTKAELGELTRILGITPGEPLDPRRVDEGIRAIQAKGRIQGLFVEGREERGRLVVTLSGSRARRLRTLTFRNVDPEVMVNAQRGLNLEEGKIADMRSFTELRDRIKEAYAERGYPFAEVTVGVTDVPESDEADVEVLVDPREATRVKAVKVTGGSKEDNEHLASLMGLRRGDVYSKRVVDEGVERINRYLRSSGYPTSKVEQVLYDFSQDKLQVEIRILLKMDEKFLFRFRGNTVFNDIQLRGMMTEEVLSQIDASARIIDLVEIRYREIGYHFVKVTVSERVDRTLRQRTITFDIEEGPKVLIDSLNISGGAPLGASALRRLFYRHAPGVLSRKVYWERGMGPALDNLRRVLVEDGYLSASVGSPRAVFSQDREGVDIFVDVEPGGRTYVTAIEVKGVFQFPGSRIQELLGVRVGEPINRKAIEEGKARILEAYYEAGFVDAKFADGEPVELSSNRREATVRLEVVEGVAYVVGDVTVVGNDKTDDDVILREMKLAPGDRFNPWLLRNSEENIALLGLFSRAEVLASNNPSQPNRKDLKIVVKENRPGLGEVGFGGEFEDPTLRLRSFFGVNYRNLMGRNQTVSVRGEASLPFTADRFIPFVEYAALLGYRVPYPLDVPLTFSSQVGLDGFQIKPVGPTIQRRARIENRIEKRLSGTITALYRLHRYERTSTEVLDSDETDPSVTVDVIGSTGPGIILDLRDDPFNPARGSYHTFDLELAHPSLGSADRTAFLMAITRNAFFVPLISSFQLAAFVGVGYARSLYGGAPLPRARLDADLALGGQLSIRGFKARIFAPPPNVTQTAFANVRLEMSVPLFSNISGALFFDSGQIFPDLRADRRHDGVGFGVRYKTPVGPLVIDIAQGLGPDSDNAVKFYFTVGTF